jgi:NAD(P)-dependent dehydrogenase (short-subunit alcohol dehydrogenase family)
MGTEMTADGFDLRGNTALITGGGSGLGLHFANTLADAGARVVLCARRVGTIEAAAASIRERGGDADCAPMDVTDAASITAAFDHAWASGPVNIVVNNAGMTAEPTLLKMTEEIWDQVMDTNLKGAWMVAREAVSRLAEAPDSSGSIINIASILGTAVQKGTGPYGASKAGLLHLNRIMAMEWARYSIRVNAIAPGYFATDLAEDFLATDFATNMIKRIPQRRLGNLDDLTGAILLLASNASAHMTGTVITVDGGHSMAAI